MTPLQILSRLEELLGAYGAPRRLRDAIESELISSGLPSLRAAELAESRAFSVSRLITKKEADSHKSGTLYPLSLLPTPEFIAGSCYALPEDAPEIALIKNQRGAAAQILMAMQSLTFNEFEQFGSRVLQELGATNTKVTKQSNDQGIDFYGELSLGVLGGSPAPFFRLAHDVRFIFAGQAKHYPNRSLSTNVVRELVGAMSLARTRTFSTENLDLLDGMNVRPFSPVLALLFTTGELSSGAVYLSNQAGVIARSGEQLAVFLAEKGIGLVSAGDQMQFVQETFIAWITGNPT